MCARVRVCVRARACVVGGVGLCAYVRAYLGYINCVCACMCVCVCVRKCVGVFVGRLCECDCVRAW